jgi:hypothetical protein
LPSLFLRQQFGLHLFSGRLVPSLLSPQEPREAGREAGGSVLGSVNMPMRRRQESETLGHIFVRSVG